MITTTTINLIIAGICLILSPITYKFPKLINFYRYVPDEKKNLYRNIISLGALTVGILTIIAQVIFSILGNEYLQSIVPIYFFIIYGIVCILALLIMRETISSTNSAIGIGISIFVIAVFAITTLHLNREATMTLTDTEIEVDSSYGKNIPLRAIRSVEMVQKLPALKYRVKGHSGLDGITKNGTFMKADNTKCQLYIFNNKNIIKITTDAEDVYVCLSDEKKNEVFYNELLAAVKK